ncbi:hypothetical protein [Agrococcus sp. KRD186]|uniref:hypothetical protein n=1 Tax=Agrococcus sp. KRD186 TaxID=2729730 RepID=UPI0019D1CC87|nr:hypothetical protein [Agrococcus sp. KRD186]
MGAGLVLHKSSADAAVGADFASGEARARLSWVADDQAGVVEGCVSWSRVSLNRYIEQTLAEV